MPVSGSRLPKSEATRVKLVECAVQEIVEAGPDRLGFTSIARRAGMTTGALYARYENADELFIDVWLHSCLPVLRAVVDDLVVSLSDDPGTSLLTVTQRIHSMDPALVAAVRILVCARRNDTLAEVVEPSFKETMARGIDTNPAFPFLMAHVLGYVIGTAGSGLTHLDWVGPLSVASRAVKHAEKAAVDKKKLVTWAETPHHPEGDDVDTRLFFALSDVIGKVGVDRATVSRIARNAGVNPATIYMRYEDKEALIKRVVGIIAEMGVARNRELVDRLAARDDTDQGIAMFRGNASDEYASIRRLRLETMIAAGYHPELRDVVRRIYADAASTDAESFGIPAIATDPTLMAFILFMRFMFFGHAVLREYGYLTIDDPRAEAVLNGITSRISTLLDRYAGDTSRSKK